MACWLAAAAILGLGSWVICYAPGCGAPPIDVALMQWFELRRTDSADRLFRAITWLGSAIVLVPLVTVGMVILVFCRRICEAYFLGVSLLGTIAIMHLSKFTIARPQPMEVNALIGMPSDPSFPSAHSAQIASVMLAGLVVSARYRRSWSIGLLPFALLLIALVGVSRVYLKVPYPSDVIAGIVVGALCVAGLAFWMFPRSTVRQGGDAQ